MLGTGSGMTVPGFAVMPGSAGIHFYLELRIPVAGVASGCFFFEKGASVKSGVRA
jgi:hypothetical protein